MEPPVAVRGRRRARREGQGASVDPAVSARTTSTTGRCAASTARASSRARRCRATGRRRRSTPDSGTADVRGRQVRDRQLALGGRAVLRPLRQAAGEAGLRDRDRVQERPAPLSFPAPRGTLNPERPAPAHPARRRRVAQVRREDPGHAVAESQSVYMDFPVLEARRADPGRLRAAPARRHARRPDALHPRRRSRARLARADADSERLGEEAAADFPNYAAGTWGPRPPTSSSRRTGGAGARSGGVR